MTWKNRSNPCKMDTPGGNNEMRGDNEERDMVASRACCVGRWCSLLLLRKRFGYDHRVVWNTKALHVSEQPWFPENKDSQEPSISVARRKPACGSQSGKRKSQASKKVTQSDDNEELPKGQSGRLAPTPRGPSLKRCGMRRRPDTHTCLFRVYLGL